MIVLCLYMDPCKLNLGFAHSPMGNLLQEAEAIKERFKANDKTFKLARLAFNATVWHIWQERNRRVFHQPSLHKVMIFRKIYEDIIILLRTPMEDWKRSKKAGDPIKLGSLTLIFYPGMADTAPPLKTFKPCTASCCYC